MNWLSETIKKEQKEECHICQLLGEVLVIQKFIVVLEKNGSCHGIKTDILRITYSIFSTLIPKSVLVFFIFNPTSFDDTDLIIARPQSVICRLPFWSVPRYRFADIPYFWRHFGLPISSAAEQLSEPFHLHAVDPSFRTTQQFEKTGSQQQFKKKTSVSIKN